MGGGLECLEALGGRLIPVLASAGGVDPLVRDIGFCLITAGALCILFTRAKIPSIAAFLAAGILVGPQVGGLVTDPENIETIANLGLTLLLFVIGLEIDLKKLFASGKTLLVAGAFQVPLCVAFGFGFTYLLRFTGWSAAGGAYLPVYVGFTVALSSTLLVVKLFQEKFQLDTVVGRISLGILIFQDVWAIVILAVQPNFASPELGPVGGTFLGILVLSGVSVAVAKYVLPAAFRWISKTPELMLVAATGWCFGVGTLGQRLGDIAHLAGLHLPVSVSMEMGALIAGVSIASLPYSHEVVSKVAVVRDFFVTLFFVGLGMGIPRPEGIEVILFALTLAGATLLSRAVIFFPLLYFTGLDRRSSLVTSTKLAQVSEFCLVIAYLGAGFGHLDSRAVSSVIFAFVLLALALARTGRLEEAEHHFRQALAVRPDSAEVLRSLGIVSSANHRIEEAQRYLEQSLRLNPNDAVTHAELGAMRLRQNRLTEAVQHLRTALSLDPQQPRALERLAWVLATAPAPELRNGTEAVLLAERAVQLSREQFPEPLDTLAAAFAEAGRFRDAVATAEKALRLARDPGRAAQTAEIAKRLELYRRGQPFRAESP